MRTTRKDFRQQVRYHIWEILDGFSLNEKMESLKETVNEFHSWYSTHEQQRNPNKINAFKDFINGLPSTFNIEFEYDRIDETLRSWFETIGETYVEYTPDRYTFLYYHLITDEFMKLCKEHNIDF